MSVHISKPSALRAPKQLSVLDQLRNQIVMGNLAPGSRLPSCRELSELHGVSTMTVQRVLDYLSNDGFIQTRGSRGTFVVNRPPHLFRYGIAFATGPSGGEGGYWPPGWHALNQEALRVSVVDPRRRVVPFYNITGHTDVEEYQRLQREIRACKLAGLILVAVPPAALELAFREAPNLPCVAIGSEGSPGQTIGIDTAETELVVRSLDCLSARGCKRVAIIDLPGTPMLDPERALPLAHGRGIHIEPYWLLGINNTTHQTATNIVRLLMSGSPDNRPDGLIIVNPFLVESSTAGLVAAGLRVPQDVQVIAGGNFPHLTRAHVPVRWVGDDIREMIRMSLDAIDRVRRGDPVPQTLRIDPIFEEELPRLDPLMRLVESPGSHQS